MRKRLITVFTAFLLLAQAACGTAPGRPDPTPGPPEETRTPAPPPAPKKTPAPGQFVFTRENFPRTDGSTTQIPLGEAIACVLLGESRAEIADLIMFNRTSQSLRNLSWNYCDIILIAEPPADVLRFSEHDGFEPEMAHISTDALIFTVNAENPVDSLTAEQIRDIYAGEITNWSEVGGFDVPIIPFQRNEESGSQAAMRSLVMKERDMMKPPIDFIYASMEGLMEAMQAFDGSRGALGYTMYYYANDMEMAKGLKIIAVDGTAPGAETIRSAMYPLRVNNYAVIAKSAAEDSPERIMRDWLLSDEGQRLIESQGYVPVTALNGAGQ
ncbi:MAG: substrate-binding domain-containing protein [Oscillospiraceae bacterium]|nr:substrate-binding domain-containing protein [Oscillospiraceae bacterium]